MQKRLSNFLTGVTLLILGASTASAGSFQVTPVRATLSSKQTVGAMTVRNTGKEPAVLQLETMAWNQQQGKDIYTPTQDIIATPPIFTIPVGSSQVVRVGLRHPTDSQHELTYRLFLQEVPPPPKEGFQGLRVALRIGVPVFVQPSTIQPTALLWKLSRTADGKLELSVTNNGNTHVQLANVKLGELGKQQLAAYILPSQTANWLLKDVSIPQTLSSVPLSAQTDAGDIDAGVVNIMPK